jgi:hypothetical protein
MAPCVGKHHLRNIHTLKEEGLPNRRLPFSAVFGEADPSYAGTRCINQSPHFALASAMLERLRRRDAKYVSTNGALLIRTRFAGV